MPDISVQQPVGISPRTAAWRTAGGLLSPALSPQGGEGDPLARYSHWRDAWKDKPWASHLRPSAFALRISALLRPSVFGLRISAPPPSLPIRLRLPARRPLPNRRHRLPCGRLLGGSPSLPPIRNPPARLRRAASPRQRRMATTPHRRRHPSLGTSPLAGPVQ